MLRGSKEFASVARVRKFIRRILDQRNAGRKKRWLRRWRDESAAARDWNDPKEVWPTVTSFSTIFCGQSWCILCTSRLIARVLKALAYPSGAGSFGQRNGSGDAALAARFKKDHFTGHVVAPLMRKTWRVCELSYREEMFPSLVFRQAYDALSQWALSQEGRQRVLVDSESCGHG